MSDRMMLVFWRFWSDHLPMWVMTKPARRITIWHLLQYIASKKVYDYIDFVHGPQGICNDYNLVPFEIEIKRSAVITTYVAQPLLGMYKIIKGYEEVASKVL